MKLKGSIVLRISKIVTYVLLTFFVIIALLSLVTPSGTINEVTDNTIDCTTTIQYEAVMKQSLLNPLGGIVRPEGSLIAKITDSLMFTVTSTIAASAPVDVDLSGVCVVNVASEGLWEREFKRTIVKTTKTSDANVSYIQRIPVNLADIERYVKQIEDETGITQDRYIISLIPDLSGTIKYQDKIFPFEPVPAIKWSYLGGLIQPFTETNSDDQSANGFPRVITKTFAVTHTSTTINTLWGTSIPITVARLISIPIALLLAGFLAWRPVVRLVMARSGMSPAARINRKYKSRLITVMERPNTKGKAVVEFRAFPELVRVADQKELPILCHDGGDGIVLYFLIDPTAVYSHTADNTPAAVRQGTLLFRLAGKGGTTDAG